MGIRVALRHHTRYDYDQLTGLSPHVVRLRPAPHCRTPILSYSLKIDPAAHFINWQQDPFGNYLARVVFPEPTRALAFDVDLLADMTIINPFDFFIEEYAEQFPFEYTPAQRAELQPYLEQGEQGPLLEQWAGDHRPRGGQIIDTLVSVNRQIYAHLDYRIRLEHGVQTPEETLSLASGSCRDSTWLLVQLLRRYGLAARFVSGYLIQLRADEPSLDGPSGPEQDFTDLHAWAEVYLPGAGWVGLDPTSGLFAGEGHIPLACTPHPQSAAPIAGAADRAASEFHFSNTVTRVDEKPRVTLPYDEPTWQSILDSGRALDRRLADNDVRLSQGGEPTFVSLDDPEGAEWNHAALGERKLALSAELLQRLRDAWAPHGVTGFVQGKWYPGEPTPRWAMTCHWRTDGKPLWLEGALLRLPRGVQALAGSESAEGQPAVSPMNELAGEAASTADARALAAELARQLGVADTCVQALYEDPLYHVHLESLLPDGETLDALDLKQARSRRNLATRLSHGLDEPVGFVLPLMHDGARWQSCLWPMRRGGIYLVPGDSPAGLRLPLESLVPHPDEPVMAYPQDSFDIASPLPDSPAADSAREPPAPVPPSRSLFRTALCIEPRDGALYVFLPPLRSAHEYVLLLGLLERAVAASGQRAIIEGYEPPSDARLRSFRITPDPGVVEVNVPPALSFDELVVQQETLYALAKQSRLSAEKFMLDGRHTGTGGGNHMTLGGPRPEDSPFLRRPSILASLVTFWQHHPSLSYLFSGLFIGPTSQAPRIDEARHESLYELEMALKRIPDGDTVQPWIVDRLLRNLLIDVTGNTHRVEICIDKLYSPDGPAGRQGLVELRAFEMPPHPRMGIVQSLLVRSLVCRFSEAPYRARLVRWGTELHDRFMLPHFLWQDIVDVVEDLNANGFEFDVEWLRSFWEFRFPLLGERQVEGVTLSLRTAIEPWHVLGEEATGAGTARYVDSSVERLELKVSGLVSDRHRISCNGVKLPLRPTGTLGEYVVGVRYRAWQPPHCLHPDLPVNTPLTFDIVDEWSGRSLGGCVYHVAHPGGRNHEDFPVNANVAEGRRLARFEPDFHTPQPVTVHAPTDSGMRVSVESLPPSRTPGHWVELESAPEYPYTADLRHV